MRLSNSRRPRLEALDGRDLPAGGVLDPTFGAGGVVMTQVEYGSQVDAVAAYPAAGTANDGKVVAAGFTWAVTGPKAGTDDFAVARYNLDGSLDKTFGGTGWVATDLGASDDAAAAVRVQPDGKVVAAGQSGGDFALARYNPDGTPDGTFGSKGKVKTDFGGADRATAEVLLPGGKILLAGVTAASKTANVDLALARYNSNGTLDTTFGSAGRATVRYSQPLVMSGSRYAVDLAIDPGTGNLVVAAEVNVTAPDGSSQPAHLLARLTPSGAVDPSFGGAGTGFRAVPALTGVPAVAVQADGRVVVSGAAAPGPWNASDFAVARFTPDGAPDPAFGANGVAVIAGPQSEVPFAVLLQPDGKILVAGRQTTGTSAGANLLVARYNGADGSPDSTFGSGGVAGTSGYGFYTSTGAAAALEPDGRIILAGAGFVAPNTNHVEFGLARFLVAGPQIGSLTASPNSVPAGGDVTLTAGNITDPNPGGTVARAAFYLDADGDGVLTAADALLGYGTQNPDGTWALTFSTAGLAAGTYTVFAQAQDSLGAWGDPLAAALQVA